MFNFKCIKPSSLGDCLRAINFHMIRAYPDKNKSFYRIFLKLKRGFVRKMKKYLISPCSLVYRTTDGTV